MPRSKIDSWLMQQNGKPADPDNPLPLTASQQAVLTNVPRHGGGMMMAFNSLAGALRSTELQRTDLTPPLVNVRDYHSAAKDVPDGYSELRDYKVTFPNQEFLIRVWYQSKNAPYLFTVEDWQP